MSRAPVRRGRPAAARLAAFFAVLCLAGCSADVLREARLSASGGTEAPPPGDDRPIAAIPFITIDGARLAAEVDRSGAIVVLAGQPRVRFLRPEGVALRGNDLYVADSGLGGLYRVDLALGAMVRLASVPGAPPTLLAASAQGMLYAIDAAGRGVVWFGRTGRVDTLRSELLGRPVALAVDERRGQVVVADALSRQLVVFRSTGRAAYPVVPRDSARHRLLAVGPLAVMDAAYAVSDPLCRCLVRLAEDGAVLEAFGHNQGVPGAIAAWRGGRLLVADRDDGSVKVYAGNRLAGVLRLPGVRRAADLAIDESVLAVADPGGSQVMLFRLETAREARRS